MRKLKKRFQFLLCTLSGALLFQMAFAIKTNAQTSYSLTLEEAISKAIAANRLLKNEQIKAKGLTLKTKEADLARYGAVKFTTSYTRLSYVPPFEVSLPLGPNGEMVTNVLNPVILNVFYNQIGTRQTLYAGGRLKNSLLLAQKNEQNAQFDLQKTQAEVVLNTKTAYWNLYKAQQSLQQIELSIQQMEADLTDLKNLLKRGMLTPNDVLRMEIQIATVRMQVIDVKTGINVAQLFLNNLLQQPLLTQNKLTSSPNLTEAALDADALVNEAQSTRSELKAAQGRVEMSELATKIAKGAAMPQVVLSANGYLSNPNQRLMPADDIFYPTWDAGIALTFDIWNWRSVKNQVASAQVTTEQAKEYNLILQEQVAMEVTQQYLALQQHQERYKMAQEVLKMAQENQRIVGIRFKQGLALNSDLIDANLQVLNAQITLVNTSADWMLAKARLDRAIGKEN